MTENHKIEKLSAEGHPSAGEKPPDAVLLSLAGCAEGDSGVAVYDAQMRCVFWNRWLEAKTGVSAERMQGACVLDVFPHLREHGTDAALAQALRGEAAAAAETPYQAAGSGSTTVWLAGIYLPRRDQHGTITGAVALLQDITEEKNARIELQHDRDRLQQQLQQEMSERCRTEEILRVSEQKYRELVENANSIILRWRTDGTITFFNEFAQRFFGYGGGEILGKNVVGTIVPPTESSGRNLADMIRDIPRNPEQYRNNENENLCRDGTRVWVSWTNTAIVNDYGEIAEILSVGNNITERKQAEQELLKTKEHLEHLIESTTDLIIVSDEKGTITRVNRCFLELTGYRPEEIVGRNSGELGPVATGHYQTTTGEVMEIGEEYFSNAREMIEKLFTEGQVANWQTYLIRKDNILLPIEANLVLLKDAAGTMVGSVGVNRDITERMKTEAEKGRFEKTLHNQLRELSIKNEISEILLSTQELDDVLHMILVGATAHQALGFNRAFLLLLNEDHTVLEGKVATGPLNAEEARQIWDRLAREDQTLTELIRARHGALSAQDEPANRLVRKIAIPLRDRESIFSQAVMQGKAFNITDGRLNPAVDKEIIELLGTEAFAVVPLRSRDKSLGVLLADNFITTTKILDEDVERLRAFANHASLAIANSRLYKNLRQTVAELQKAYHELQINRDRLIQAERLSAVGRVAAQVAHDIRNPMTIVGGFARRILKQLNAGAENINVNHIKIIIKEIDRLERILNDLLSFTSPEVPQPVPVDLNSLIRSTCETFSLLMEQHHISLQERLDPGIPELKLDEGLMRRVLGNVIENAIEAMPDCGTLTLSTSCDGRQVRIEIADTGCGISDGDIQKVFDPFYTTKATGTGLGLTTSLQIIEQHGGAVQVLHEPAQGVRVIIALPAAAAG